MANFFKVCDPRFVVKGEPFVVRSETVMTKAKPAGKNGDGDIVEVEGKKAFYVCDGKKAGRGTIVNERFKDKVPVRHGESLPSKIVRTVADIDIAEVNGDMRPEKVQRTKIEVTIKGKTETSFQNGIAYNGAQEKVEYLIIRGDKVFKIKVGHLVLLKGKRHIVMHAEPTKAVSWLKGRAQIDREEIELTLLALDQAKTYFTGLQKFMKRKKVIGEAVVENYIKQASIAKVIDALKENKDQSVAIKTTFAELKRKSKSLAEKMSALGAEIKNIDSKIVELNKKMFVVAKVRDVGSEAKDKAMRVSSK